jgi:cytochrome oxidase Cu insertion factor (SCO1/SenC/PrrC family)
MVGVAMVLVLCGVAAGAEPPLDAQISDFQLVPVAPQAAPAFSLETLDGTTLAPRDLVGRPAILYFWATW